jgi:hypothetical protein
MLPFKVGYKQINSGRKTNIWTDNWIDRQMDIQTAGQIDGRTDEQTNRSVNGCINWQTYQKTERLINRQNTTINRQNKEQKQPSTDRPKNR